MSRVHKGDVKPLRKYPKATGYQEGLYSFLFSGALDDQAVEKEIFKRIDNDGAQALRNILTHGRSDNINKNDAKKISEFMNSLQIRMPEDIDVIRSRWNSTEPVLQWDKTNEEVVPSPLPSPNFSSPKNYSFEFSMYTSLDTALKQSSKVFSNLSWRIIALSDNAKFELFTSDRPIMRTYSLSLPQSTFLFPLGPKKLLWGFSKKIHPALLTKKRGKNALDGTHVAKLLNGYTVEHAVKYVYARSDKNLRFVQNRMATKRMARLSESFDIYFGKKKQPDAWKGEPVNFSDFVGYPEPSTKSD